MSRVTNNCFCCLIWWCQTTCFHVVLRCWLEGNLFGHGKHVTGCDRSASSTTTIGSQFPGDLWISHRSKELCWPRAFQGRACRAPLGFSGGPKKKRYFSERIPFGEPSSSHMISRKMTLFLEGEVLDILDILPFVLGTIGQEVKLNPAESS